MRLFSAFVAWLPRALLTLAAIGLMNFTLVRLAPGDPAAVIAGESGAADGAFIDKIRADYGLDQPIQVQVVSYLARLARGDLGVSYRSNLPVSQMIAQRLPATLILTGTALIFAIVVGTTLGIASPCTRRMVGSGDRIVCDALLCDASLWVGLLLVLIFSVALGWFPAFGMASLVPKQGLAYLIDVLHHLVLPALTLALLHMAVYVRLARSSSLEVMGRDFIRTALAKGLTDGQVLRGHVFRNAMLPIVTMAGLQLGHLMGGAIVIETVFAWPGIGRLAFDALLQRDYSVILGVFFVSSVMVVLANLVTDLALRVVDPRIGR